ncbi:hypothetical protein M413DRAFT_32034 [Hebeloma cylindrosporum]|uniref:Uncharacterized protein n=1 Tax=Hebeloma cylindrosporum TaxID=76867 RepID=A0A0C3BX15_HEBCY|nr:hypothetical protein M413DRAFT_32034 [Hebeloma cylindrosporum h7]
MSPTHANTLFPPADIAAGSIPTSTTGPLAVAVSPLATTSVIDKVPPSGVDTASKAHRPSSPPLRLSITGPRTKAHPKIQHLIVHPIWTTMKEPSYRHFAAWLTREAGMRVAKMQGNDWCVKFHRSFKNNGQPIPTLLDQVALYFVDMDKWPAQCHAALVKFLTEKDQPKVALAPPTGPPPPTRAPTPSHVPVSSTLVQPPIVLAPSQVPLSSTSLQPPVVLVQPSTAAVQSCPLPHPVPGPPHKSLMFKPSPIPTPLVAGPSTPPVAGPSKAPSLPPKAPGLPVQRRTISKPPPPSPAPRRNLRSRPDRKGKGKAKYVEPSEAEDEEDELESEEETVIKEDPDWKAMELDRPSPKPSRKRKVKAEPKSAERVEDSDDDEEAPTVIDRFAIAGENEPSCNNCVNRQIACEYFVDEWVTQCRFCHKQKVGCSISAAKVLALKQSGRKRPRAPRGSGNTTSRPRVKREPASRSRTKEEPTTSKVPRSSTPAPRRPRKRSSGKRLQNLWWTATEDALEELEGLRDLPRLFQVLKSNDYDLQLKVLKQGKEIEELRERIRVLEVGQGSLAQGIDQRAAQVVGSQAVLRADISAAFKRAGLAWDPTPAGPMYLGGAPNHGSISIEELAKRSPHLYGEFAAPTERPVRRMDPQPADEADSEAQGGPVRPVAEPSDVAEEASVARCQGMEVESTAHRQEGGPPEPSSAARGPGDSVTVIGEEAATRSAVVEGNTNSAVNREDQRPPAPSASGEGTTPPPTADFCMMPHPQGLSASIQAPPPSAPVTPQPDSGSSSHPPGASAALSHPAVPEETVIPAAPISIAPPTMTGLNPPTSLTITPPPPTAPSSPPRTGGDVTTGAAQQPPTLSDDRSSAAAFASGPPLSPIVECPEDESMVVDTVSPTAGPAPSDGPPVDPGVILGPPVDPGVIVGPPVAKVRPAKRARSSSVVSTRSSKRLRGETPPA